MHKLTFDLATSAEVLGTEPEAFLELVRRENLHGVIYFAGSPQVSIFTLARLLDTTPRELLEILENFALGELIEEVEDDEMYEGEEAKEIYQKVLAGLQA